MMTRQRWVLLLSLGTALAFVSAAEPMRVLAAEDPGPLETETPENAISLSLKDCVQAALQDNLKIAVQEYAPRRGESRLAFEESVFDPQIKGTATSSDLETRTLNEFGLPRSYESKVHEYKVGLEDPLPTGGRYRIDFSGRENNLTVVSVVPSGATPPIHTTETDTNLILSFTQPLLRNLGPDASRWRIVVARNNLNVTESQFRQTLLETVADTEKAYWELAYTLIELATVQGSLQQAKDFLEQSTIKVNAGRLARIEISQAEAQVAEREQELIVAEVSVLSAEDVLRQVMGVPKHSSVWNQPIRPSDQPPLDEVAPDLEASLAEAEANRPDLDQARLRIQSAETELAYRKNQRRWGLDFDGYYGYQGVDFDSLKTDALGNVVGIAPTSDFQDSFEVLTGGDLPTWRMSLLLSVPLGNRAAIASYQDAENALDQTRREMDLAEQQVFVETRIAVRRVASDLKRVDAARVALRLQRIKLEAIETKFESGLSTSFEVLAYQTDLARSETRLNRSIMDFNKSLVDLERVKGTLLRHRGILVSGAGGLDLDRAVDAAELRAIALRADWRRAPAASATGGLRLPDAPGEKITLPADLGFKGGRVVPREPRPGVGTPEDGAGR